MSPPYNKLYAKIVKIHEHSQINTTVLTSLYLFVKDSLATNPKAMKKDNTENPNKTITIIVFIYPPNLYRITSFE